LPRCVVASPDAVPAGASFLFLVTREGGAHLFDNRSQHIDRVDAWLRRARNLPPAAFREAFQRTFDAICERARLALGEITLGAIVGRVLDESRARFHWFGRPAARFVLVELLSVLGLLTGEILTPALHVELSRVAMRWTPRAGRPRAAPSPSLGAEAP
jgi:hypothetical protein